MTAALQILLCIQRRCLLPSQQLNWLPVRITTQGLASGGAATAALSQLWAGLAPAVPLRGLALALAYYDSSLGLAAAAAHAAALRQGAGAH